MKDTEHLSNLYKAFTTMVPSEYALNQDYYDSVIDEMASTFITSMQMDEQYRSLSEAQKAAVKDQVEEILSEQFLFSSNGKYSG